MSESTPPSAVDGKFVVKAASAEKWAPLMALFGWALGMLIGYPVIITSGLERVQTDDEDTEQLHFLMEHSLHCAADPQYKATFWTPGIFYPTPLTLAYSENMIGVAPLYWAFRLGWDASVSIQLWILAVATLNYFSMYLVLRWFGVEPVLASLGGILYAFCLPRQVQITHLHCLPQFMAPFAIYNFWHFLQRPNLRALSITMFVTVWQLLSSVYLGWFLTYGLAIWLVTVIVLDRATLSRIVRFVKTRPAYTTGLFVVTAIGVGAFFRNYYIGNQEGRRSYAESIYFAPAIGSWFAGPTHSLWSRHLTLGEYPLDEVEHLLFAGIGLSAMFFIALIFGWESWHSNPRDTDWTLAFSCTLTALILILTTLNFGQDVSLWYFVHQLIPGANSLRAIGRVCFVVFLFALPAGLIAVQRLLDRSEGSRPRRHILTAGLFVLCCGEQVWLNHGSRDRREISPHYQHLARQLTDADAAFVIKDPADRASYVTHDVRCMWAAMMANMPVINGYSGRDPANYPEHNGQNIELDQILDYLGDSWSGRLLVVRLGPSGGRDYYDVKRGGKIVRIVHRGLEP